MNEERMSVTSTNVLIQFIAFLSLHSKNAIDRLLKSLHDKGRELQNHVENLFTQFFQSEIITQEEIERILSDDNFKEYIDCCSMCCMIFLCEAFLQEKYHQPIQFSMKDMNIPDFLNNTNYSIDRCLMVIDCYNTKAIKKAVVKEFKTKVLKRKPVKRKYEEDKDYYEYTCLFSTNTNKDIIPQVL